MLTSNPLGKVAVFGIFCDEPCGMQSDELPKCKNQILKGVCFFEEKPLINTPET